MPDKWYSSKSSGLSLTGTVFHLSPPCCEVSTYTQGQLGVILVSDWCWGPWRHGGWILTSGECHVVWNPEPMFSCHTYHLRAVLGLGGCYLSAVWHFVVAYGSNDGICLSQVEWECPASPSGEWGGGVHTSGPWAPARDFLLRCPACYSQVDFWGDPCSSKPVFNVSSVCLFLGKGLHFEQIFKRTSDPYFQY